MKRQKRAGFFSARQRPRWRAKEQSIWALTGDHSGEDAALSVLRTLQDQPRWLEPYHLYDETGSRLFERICELPEYYLTRTEDSILAEKARDIIAAAPVECIAELGAGTSRKSVRLLKEQLRQRGSGTFAPIDVSPTALAAARQLVRRELPGLAFRGLCSRYEEAIAAVEKNLPTLFVFLGSTVGNFNRSDFVRFFSHLSRCMGAKDFFLLGVDRIKEAATLEKAYNDPQGVTARFILNVFQNVNRLTQSNFDSGKIRYHSWYNPEWQQIEMYGVATGRQEIFFPSHGTSFVWERDDRILVEISRKFDPVRLQEQLRLFGLKAAGHFTDPREWFSLLLFQKSNAI